MATRFLAGTLLAAAMLLPLGAAGPTTQDVNIDIQNFAYNPNPVEALVGETVTWDNLDALPHSATADDNSFNSGTLLGGTSFSHVFTVAGTFDYHCNLHAAMHGRIRVGDPTQLADLTITGLALPASPPDTLPGVQQRIDVTVRNLGANNAEATQLAISYRYHGTLHPIATLEVPILGPGEDTTLTASWITLGKVGDFVLVVEADSGGAIAEASEGNNVAEALASVLLSGAEGLDLAEPL